VIRRFRLAEFARAIAAQPLVGDSRYCGPDLAHVLSHFPRDDMAVGFEWCAAFVYHCCYQVGIRLPIQYPDSHVSCRFAGVRAWLEWSTLPAVGFYRSATAQGFQPGKGDIVVFDQLVSNGYHDHIGIVVAARRDILVTAEGNVNNRSGVFSRSKHNHINGYIRIPENYTFSA
jgi:hypothetical protein